MRHLALEVVTGSPRDVIADPHFEDVSEQEHGIGWRLLQVAGKGVPGGVVLLQVQVRDKIGAAPGGRGEHMGHGCFGGSGGGQVGHQDNIRSKKKPRKQ